MDELNKIVMHLNNLQSKEVFVNVSCELRYKIKSNLTVITYRDIDKMIKACNEHVYRVENNITFN